MNASLGVLSTVSAGNATACSIITCPSDQINVQTGQTAEGCPIYVCKPAECSIAECGNAYPTPHVCSDGINYPKIACLRQINGTCSWQLKTPCPSVCGNGICEEGEAGYCPPCTSKPCLAMSCYLGTCPQDCNKKKCPAIECPAPPDGCTYTCGKDENGCMTCGNIVCKSCPPLACPGAAPPSGCTYSTSKDENGCETCGHLVCAESSNSTVGQTEKGTNTVSTEPKKTSSSWACSHFKIFC